MGIEKTGRACIILADNYPQSRMTQEARALLEATNELVTLDFGYSQEELFECLSRVDVIISKAAPITEGVLDAAPRLKAIVNWGVGYDHVDVPSATRRGIYVTNTQGSNAEAVAEMTFSLMLSLARRTHQADRLVRKGAWKSGKLLPSWLTGVELRNRILGIVGMGAVGRCVAKIAKGFGMRVLVYDPYAPAENIRHLGGNPVDLDSLLRESDVVTIHAPLTEETRELVNGRRIALMKPTAFLINTARGPIVDQTALIEALQTRRIAGAGLDVFASEPLPHDHGLLALDDVILTPHIAAITEEAMKNASRMVVRQVLQVLRGEVPDNLVNRSVLEQGG